jgi:hypothetical protein
VVLDPWQEVVLQAAMGERSDGTWTAKQIGLSAPRQNGKSQLIVARALAGALLFGEKKIVISAHAQDTARETFAKFIEQIDESPALAERIDKVMNALNREFIKFRNGAVVQFKARTVSGSRGFSSDCLLLDEAQILGMPAWGTPPTPEDNGEVFTSIRESAMGGRSKTLVWLEWSADSKDDPALAATRAKANPAWETRINHEVVQGEFDTYPPERFALDRLGIWLSDLSVQIMPGWAACVSDDEPAPAALALALDVERVWLSLGAASGSDVPHLGSVFRVRLNENRADTLDEIARIATEHHLPVVLDGRGPASTLVEELEARGINVITATLDDYLQACAELFDAVEAQRITHGNYPSLNAAVDSAGWRIVNDRRAWSRKRGDVSMLEAVTLALWQASRTTYDPMDSFG